MRFIPEVEKQVQVRACFIKLKSRKIIGTEICTLQKALILGAERS